MKPSERYTIQIKVIDNFNEEEVVTVKTKSVKEIEENLRLLDKMISQYTEEKYKHCHQCDGINHIDDMSIPEDIDYVWICQECLQDIMDGDIKLKRI